MATYQYSSLPLSPDEEIVKDLLKEEWTIAERRSPLFTVEEVWQSFIKRATSLPSNSNLKIELAKRILKEAASISSSSPPPPAVAIGSKTITPADLQRYEPRLMDLCYERAGLNPPQVR